MDREPDDETLPAPQPRVARGTVVAWGAILAVVGLAFSAQFFPADDEGLDARDRLGLILMRIQSQYIVGVAGFSGDADQVYDQARMLEVGSLGQRQRFVTLAAELAGPAEAGRALVALDHEMRNAQQRADLDFKPTSRETVVQGVLRALYLEDDLPVSDEAWDPAARLATVPTDEQELFREDLSWFSRLALSPVSSDETTRAAVMKDARGVMLWVIATFVLLGAAGLAGLVGLVVFAVAAYKRQLEFGMEHRSPHAGIYAETFALWIVIFFTSQAAVGLLAQRLPQATLLLSAAAFFGSLVALYWPVRRGLAWDEVKRDIGWVRGRLGPFEPFAGLAGYVMAIPMLAAGLGATFVLMLVQSLFAPPMAPFEPAGGPAHPIVLELARGGLGLKLQVLFLASVAAPIVEETMFRGVLYRHLRDSSRRMGPLLSALFTTALSSFLFAAVHPQGWVAIPALGGLAAAFCLLREWRGSLLPAMVAHGVSNGIVMTALLGLLSGAS